MTLLDEKLLQRFQEVGEQIHTDNPLILARFYTSRNDREWLISEYFPNANAFYGYVIINGRGKWSYFRMPETIEGLTIERDFQFKEAPFENMTKFSCLISERGRI